MKNKLTLSTDRKSASEGEYIEVSWDVMHVPIHYILHTIPAARDTRWL